MKIKVVGPRILVQVKKFKEEDIKTFEDSIILKADTGKEQQNYEAVNQTIGEVVQLGNMAYKRKDAGCDGTSWVKVGDKVHFSRHGAQRIGTKDDDDFEHWILMDKDILAIEEV